jgi:hypothetical protein
MMMQFIAGITFLKVVVHRSPVVGAGLIIHDFWLPPYQCL